jgi:hypothetical protein
MIHVATVHYQNEEWIDIQLDYLHENLGEDYKVYAFLNEIDERHRSKFFYSSTEPVAASGQEKEHAIKLNLLADVIQFSADSPEDILVFLDGDAFPISDVSSYARSVLKEYPLAAVRRTENAGDIQPHPSFCITTVGFWDEIDGDWKPGYKWVNDTGKVTDVGGNLLGILERKNIEWHPMLRSNKENHHPVWFGVYDDIVYHHGAGFRDSISRADTESNPWLRVLRVTRWLSMVVPRYVPGLGKVPGVEFIQDKLSRKTTQLEKSIVSSNEILSRKIFKNLKNRRGLNGHFRKEVIK